MVVSEKKCYDCRALRVAPLKKCIGIIQARDIKARAIAAEFSLLSSSARFLALSLSLPTINAPMRSISFPPCGPRRTDDARRVVFRLPCLS